MAVFSRVFNFNKQKQKKFIQLKKEKKNFNMDKFFAKLINKNYYLQHNPSYKTKTVKKKRHILPNLSFLKFDRLLAFRKSKFTKNKKFIARKP
jgi:hypothetical protein